MNTNTYPEPALWRKSPLPDRATCWNSLRGDAALEFGSFQVMLRRRRLLADGVPVELGTRAFDLLLVLLQADGALVTKEELFDRVWPGIVVSQENLKTQIFALRKALGSDRNLIHTEYGRGYRFIGILQSNATAHACRDPSRAKLRVCRALLRQKVMRAIRFEAWGYPSVLTAPPRDQQRDLVSFTKTCRCRIRPAVSSRGEGPRFGNRP